MKIKGLMLCALSVAAATGTSKASLSLEFATMLSEQLPYLSPYMGLEVRNEGDAPVLFPANAFNAVLYVQEAGSWKACRPRTRVTPLPLAKVEWKAIEPRARLELTVPATTCRDGDEFEREWMNQPGTHRLKWVLTSLAHQIEAAAGAFSGTLESNVLEFRIKQPIGVDAQAIEWAKGSPMRVEVLKAFPTSEYAAFYAYSKCGRPHRSQPSKIAAQLHSGMYPPPGSSLPNDAGEWKSLSSEGVAHWQIDWGSRILHEHPDFPFADELRVSIALAQLRLGQEQKALRTLTSVTEKGGVLSDWVGAFLEIRKQEMRGGS